MARSTGVTWAARASLVRTARLSPGRTSSRGRGSSSAAVVQDADQVAVLRKGKLPQLPVLARRADMHGNRQDHLPVIGIADEHSTQTSDETESLPM